METFRKVGCPGLPSSAFTPSRAGLEGLPGPLQHEPQASSVVGRLHSPCPRGLPSLVWLRHGEAQAGGQTLVPIWHSA